MSRSNNTEIKNPASRFFKWSGAAGNLSYFDKESKENVAVGIPFHFLVLDKLVTIAGFSDEDQSGFWSNEIRNTKNEILTVRSKSGIKREGLYEQIKSLTGAKYAQSLYIAFFNDEKALTIGNIKLTGCAVSAWIEFSKGRDIYQGAITIKGALEDKKGATKFFSPVFEQNEKVSEASNEAATKLDGELQEYLKSYFALRGQVANDVPNEDYIEVRNRELEEFEPDKAQSAAANSFGSAYGDHVQKDDSEGDEIPF